MLAPTWTIASAMAWWLRVPRRSSRSSTVTRSAARVGKACTSSCVVSCPLQAVSMAMSHSINLSGSLHSRATCSRTDPRASRIAPNRSWRCMRTVPQRPCSAENDDSLSLHRPQREASDETIQEDVVEEGDRDGHDGGRGHQRLPEEDVTPDQLRRYPDRDRLLLRGRDEGERIDELVHGQREAKDHDRQQAWYRHRQNRPPDGSQPAVAIDQRLLFDITGDRLEEAHQQPGAKGDREAGIDEHHRPPGVAQSEIRNHPRKRDEEQRRRHKVDEEDG